MDNISLTITFALAVTTNTLIISLIALKIINPKLTAIYILIV